MTNTPYIPQITPYLMPREGFEALIAKTGVRTTWMKSHTCPCIFSGGGAQGRLPFPGSPDPACTKCFGVGTYWDAPSTPFLTAVSFMHLSPSPDEPGTVMDPKYGPVQTSEPSMTIPAFDPSNPGQPVQAWQEASTNDLFVMVDMLARYTAVLQAGGVEALPYQQNLQIAPSGAVTTYDPVTFAVAPVEYTVSGATIVTSLPPGTNFAVEFSAAPIFVAWRRAGGLPHIRPFGGGIVNLPRRFRLQALDFWTRQRQDQGAQGYSANAQGKTFPYVVMSGQAVVA